MKMAMSKCKQSEEDEQMPKKKNMVDWFVFLSDDILEKILKGLPVASGPHTTNQIFVREVKEGLRFEAEFIETPYKGRIKSWCNEFLLIIDPNKQESLYLFNLYTKEGFYLPKCPSSCGGHYTCKCGVSLSFDGLKGVYKVLHVYMGPPIECRIFVFSKGIPPRVRTRWKTIEVPSDMGEEQHYWREPVSVQGRYFHWHAHSPKYLVSMDMVKEKFSKTLLPDSGDDRTRNQYSFVEMSGFLALLDKDSFNKVYIWILKDFEKMKWEKVKSLSHPRCDWHLSMYPANHLPFPICNVINKRYILFRKPGNMTYLYSYDLEANIISKIHMEAPVDKFVNHYVAHSVAPSFV